MQAYRMEVNARQWAKFASHVTIPPDGYVCITLALRRTMGIFTALPVNMIIFTRDCKKKLTGEFMALQYRPMVWKQTAL